jgi:hypothetical protein
MNDTQHCPACGALNQCSLADPRSATLACWCYSVNIDPAVLQALPAELRNKACLCPRCAAVQDQLEAAEQHTVDGGLPAKKPATR